MHRTPLLSAMLVFAAALCSACGAAQRAAPTACSCADAASAQHHAGAPGHGSEHGTTQGPMHCPMHGSMGGSMHGPMHDPPQSPGGNDGRRDGAAHGDHNAAVHHRFDDAEAWAREFENPARNAWQRPDWVLAQLALSPDARVADVGSGTGYFAIRIGRAVPAGRVWAADVEPAMVRYVNARARREGVSNVWSVLAEPGDPMIPEPVDLVLIVDTYHHLSDRLTYFGALRARLRPSGRVAIIDFTAQSPIGPPAHARIAPEVVRSEMQTAGYAFDREIAGLPNQYFLLFRAAAPSAAH